MSGLRIINKKGHEIPAPYVVSELDLIPQPTFPVSEVAQFVLPTRVDETPRD